MAAVLGGTQSLHTNSKDEALALPSQEAAKIALRTQQIIGYESGITKTVDPMAGSYYIESLCDEIEEQVWDYLKKIDKMGGALKAIEKGFFQSEGKKQEKAIKQIRKSRDNKKTEYALSKMQKASETDENLMPFILDSVLAYATTGEISNTFREVFGEYRPKEVF